MVERDMDWIDHNQILNFLVSFISLIYGCMFLLGQESLWDVYFHNFVSDKNPYSEYESYITSTLGIMFLIYSSHSFNLARIDTEISNRMSLFTNTSAWFGIFIMNWYFLKEFTVTFKALNSIITTFVFFYSSYNCYLLYQNNSISRDSGDSSSSI